LGKRLKAAKSFLTQKYLYNDFFAKLETINLGMKNSLPK